MCDRGRRSALHGTARGRVPRTAERHAPLGVAADAASGLRSRDPVRAVVGDDPPRSPGKESEVSLDQKRARAFGVLYLLTFATSIPALVLYETVLRHPVAYITGGGHDTQVLLAALLELLLILA